MTSLASLHRKLALACAALITLGVGCGPPPTPQTAQASVRSATQGAAGWGWRDGRHVRWQGQIETVRARRSELSTAHGSLGNHVAKAIRVAAALAVAPDHEANARSRKAAKGARAIPWGAIDLRRDSGSEPGPESVSESGPEPGSETQRFTVYDDSGRMLRDGALALSEAITQTQGEWLEPALIGLLYAVARDFDRPIVVVSASLHQRGAELAFYVPDISTKALWSFCATHLRDAQVGARLKAGTVHVAVGTVVGDSAFYWLDTSRPGADSEERLVAAPNSELDADSPTWVDAMGQTRQSTRKKRPKDSQRLLSAETSPNSAGKGRNVYVVKRGDTVSAIAKRHGVSVADIVAWNRLDKNATIRRGQKLVIKGGRRKAKRRR